MHNHARAFFDTTQHLCLKLAPVAYFNIAPHRLAALYHEHSPSITMTE
jgi:hypothetical protein